MLSATSAFLLLVRLRLHEAQLAENVRPSLMDVSVGATWVRSLSSLLAILSLASRDERPSAEVTTENFVLYADRATRLSPVLAFCY